MPVSQCRQLPPRFFRSVDSTRGGLFQRSVDLFIQRAAFFLGPALLSVQGFQGAVLVMTLAVYPLVYLPVAASLRGADPGQEEIARSLGASWTSTFVRITLAQARRAILGGCLLVALVILAEYGAFEILGYQTFTTEIFTEFTVGLDTSSSKPSRRIVSTSTAICIAPRAFTLNTPALSVSSM